ncbi:MAG: hypothetical protein KDA85_08005, partial [Planctomycetaceae bacterium]|nr:hypothetical protein [Planctomycetaceae bacterium]
RYVEAERLVISAAQHAPADRVSSQLFEIRRAALYHGRHVSWGEGDTLYRRLYDETVAQLLDPEIGDDFDRVLQRWHQILIAAERRRIAAAEHDLRQLTQNEFHTLIRRHSAQSQLIVSRIGDQLMRLADRETAVEFLLDRMESPSVALQWTQPRQRWNANVPRLQELVLETVTPPATNTPITRYRPALRRLRDRYETVVLDGFHETLLAQDGSNLALFGPSSSQHLRQHHQAVLNVVERALAETSGSISHLQFITNFLLGYQPPDTRYVIRILQDKAEHDELDTSLQNRLVDLLISENRDIEALRIIDKLVAASPQDIATRLKRMPIAFRLGRRALLQDDLTYLKTKLIPPETANESLVVQLASTCRSCLLWDEAVSLYEAAIRRHGSPRTVDHSLSDLYASLSICQAHLGLVPDAVDSAAAAWTVCGNDPARRATAQEMLTEALRQADDLTPVVRHVEETAVRNQRDSSFLRRSLGIALMETEHWAAAESQLRTALELQSLDSESWTRLRTCLQRQHKPEAAVEVLLDQIETEPRSLSLYEELYDQLISLNESRLAERGATSIVEVGLNESENHAKLAELRERTNHLNAAIVHWRQAAELKQEEPGPLLSLFDALLKAGQRNEARRTLQTLRAKKWDERFEELPTQLRERQQQLRNQ